MKHDEFFLISPEDVYHDLLYIRGNEYKHLVQVLRKKIGDSATATDGQGSVYDFLITQISSEQAVAEIQKRRRRVGEPFFQLTLAQAVLKGDHFEWIIEKGTEIGVTTFIPVTTEHTIPEIKEQKRERYQRIAQEAMKQCCRSVLPQIENTRSLSQLLAEKQTSPIKLIAHPCREAISINQAIEHYRQKVSSLKFTGGVVLVGPEGGFSDSEVKNAIASGFQPVSLSKRRLRAETAGLAASVLVLEKMGEF